MVHLPTSEDDDWGDALCLMVLVITCSVMVMLLLIQALIDRITS